jgi:SAM-dependent methyltransferase
LLALKDLEYPVSRWSQLVDRFHNKNLGDFFPTEHLALHSLLHLSNPSILDIGCACGRSHDLFAEYFQSFNYTGVDIVQEQVDLACKLYPNSRFICRAFEDLLPSSMGTFDIVYCIGVLQHISTSADLFELFRALGPRSIVFDCKTHLGDNDITDINISSAGTLDYPLHFNIFSRKNIYYIIDSLFPEFDSLIIDSPMRPSANVKSPPDINYTNTIVTLTLKAT